jgi:hypothetical protein
MVDGDDRRCCRMLIRANGRIRILQPLERSRLEVTSDELSRMAGKQTLRCFRIRCLFGPQLIDLQDGWHVGHQYDGDVATRV